MWNYNIALQVDLLQMPQGRSSCLRLVCKFKAKTHFFTKSRIDRSDHINSQEINANF